MRKISKIACIFSISFICMLIPNLSFGATKWKDERTVKVNNIVCNNSSHKSCYIYDTGTRKVHIGTDGFYGNDVPVMDKDKGLICLQHNKDSDGEFGDKREIHYRMEIDESEVTLIPISDEAKADSGNKIMKTNSDYSARFAFILSHISTNPPSKEERESNGTQGAVWEIIPSFWAELKQKTTFDDGEGDEANKGWVAKGKEITEQSKLATNLSEPIKIDTTVGITESGDYYIIGPFEMRYSNNSYTGKKDIIKFSGYVSSSLKMGSTNLTSSDWQLCDKSGNNISEPNSNGTSFYIKIKKSKMQSKGSLSINVKRMKSKASIYTMVSVSGKQEHAFVVSASRYYVPDTITFDFETSGNLRIDKKDADNNTELAGVKFKIKNSNGYLKIIDNKGTTLTSAKGIVNIGSIQTTSNKSEGTELVTNEKGIIELHNLIIGKYTVEEISVGNNFGYLLSDANVTWTINTDSGTGKSINVSVTKQPPSKTGVSTSLVENEYVTIIQVKNKKTVGNINIKKVNESNANLEGVEFVLKSSYDNNKYVRLKTQDDVWINKAIGTIIISKIEYTTNINEATRFVTDSNGEIKIQNIEVKDKSGNKVKYILQEVYNPYYGYTELFTININEIQETASEPKIYTIKNTKYVGEIGITKVDSKNANIKLEGVEYVLKSSYQNGYLKIKGKGNNVKMDSSGWLTSATGEVIIDDTKNIETDPSVKYVATAEEATKFVTDANGVFHISNLLVSYNGTNIEYQLIETKNSNYGYTKYTNATIKDIAVGENKTITVTNEKTVGDIGITKVDSKDANIKLEGVEYVVKSSYQNGYLKIKGKGNNVKKDSSGWLTSATGEVEIDDTKNMETDSSVKYVATAEEATKFITDTNGVIYISNLLVNYNGTNIEYQLIEIKNPNYGYTKLENVTMKDIAVGEKRKITVTNIKQTGDINITKVDSDDGSIKLEGVEYVVKSSYQNKYIKIKGTGDKVTKGASGWLTSATGTVKIDDTKNIYINPTLEYTANKNEATKFITDSGGKIVIQNLLTTSNGTNVIKYEFQEQKNLNYGYTKLVNVTVNKVETGGETPVTIKNEKQVGDIDITKIDSDDGSIKLEGVEYVVKSSYQNKYIKIKGTGDKVTKDASGWLTTATGTVKVNDTININTNPTLEYTANKDEATKFITNAEGKIVIQNLLVTSNGTNVIKYEIQEQKNLNYGYTKVINVTVNKITRAGQTPVTIKNEKQVGDIDIKKIDEVVISKKLAGVEFVLKSSYQNGYIQIKGIGDNVTKDSSGWTTKCIGKVKVDDTKDREKSPTLKYTTSIEQATKFITDANGEIHIKNLLISSDGKDKITYKLEETANSNYGYLVDSKKYPKFKADSVVTADGVITLTRNKAVTVTVRNHQEYIRVKGYVWEEINKEENKTNDLYDKNIDALIKGLNVYLCRNGKVVTTKVTDEDGAYSLGTIRPEGEYYKDSDYTTAENGNLEIDSLGEYSIEFEYDGLRFTSVKAIIEYQNQNYDRTSKATEVPSGRSDKKDRATVNESFAIISNKRANNGEGKRQYELDYDVKDHVATYKDKWGYEYSNNNTRLSVTRPAKGEYAIIATTKQSGFDLKGAWEARCKNIGAEVLTGINLGIYRREQSDLAVSEDLTEMDIIVNNGRETYKNTYTYAKRNIDGDTTSDNFGVDVKFGTNAGSYSSRGLDLYTRRVYESDLALENKQLGAMQIYVTYKIRVKNQSNSLTMKVVELANYYDARYEIAKSWMADSNGRETGSVSWGASKYGTASMASGYTAGYTSALANTQLEAGKYVDVYIQFKLKQDAVKALIEKQTTLYNVTEINAFSTIADGKPYAAIDEDSNPGSVTISFENGGKTNLGKLENRKPSSREYQIEDKTLNDESFEDDTDSAPALVIGIEDGKTTRGLSGTVFEDKSVNGPETRTGEARIGDGIFGNGENGVEKAIVDLLYEDGTPVELYQLEVEGGTVKTKTVKASVETDANGDYKFLGVVPGRYLIRYTYNSETKINGNKIDPREYKSTIIASTVIKNALAIGTRNEKRGDYNWILKQEKDNRSQKVIRYSDAVDDLGKRAEQEQNGIYYGNIDSDATMTADTAYFDVGVEYSDVTNKVTLTDFKDEYNLKDGKIVVMENGKIKLVNSFYSVNPNQDFGIIERPRQYFETNKRISNIKLTLLSGQVLIDGNPYVQIADNELYDKWDDLEKSANALRYVKALPGSVVAEIDNEIIQGATLEVEYTISIKNSSELDYEYSSSPDYYYFGKVLPGQELKSVIKKVVDYMDEDIVFSEDKNADYGWSKITADELSGYKENGIDKKLIAKEVRDNVQKGYTIAMTSKFEDVELKAGSVGSIKIYGSRLLSSTEKGIGADNNVEVVETRRKVKDVIPGNYNPKGKETEKDDDKTRVSITPPTGAFDNTIVIISIAGISLIILAGGVYFIRKKVL